MNTAHGPRIVWGSDLGARYLDQPVLLMIAAVIFLMPGQAIGEQPPCRLTIAPQRGKSGFTPSALPAE
jgi:hypothetical protein